jgi:predicted esterase
VIRVASIRMIPFGRALRRSTRGSAVAIWLLRYRYRGWNEPYRDPLSDLSWALAEVRRRHPGAQAVLLGHSMGGRAALWGAGDPTVIGVCALAPWLEPGDPVDQLAGRRVLIAHGDRDRITDPAESRRYAQRARRYNPDIEWRPIPNEAHALLRRPATSNALITAFVASTTGDLG